LWQRGCGQGQELLGKVVEKGAFQLPITSGVLLVFRRMMIAWGLIHLRRLQPWHLKAEKGVGGGPQVGSGLDLATARTSVAQAVVQGGRPLFLPKALPLKSHFCEATTTILKGSD